jgi:peptidoglycan/xylan/chitin deacetylase (PgdA/CDA1 family)
VSGLAPAAVLLDYETGRRAVEEVAGRAVALFRPPHGHLSLAVAPALRRAGLATRLWTVDPGDYVPGTSVEDVVAVVGGAGPGDVVLLHDVLEEAPERAPSRDVVIKALPGAIQTLRGRGLAFVGLS